MDSQTLAALDLAVSTSVSPVDTPPADTPSVNTPAATTPTCSAPSSPMIMPNKKPTAQDPVSYQLLSFVEIVQRLQDAVAASELEKSELKDENNQLKALLVKVEKHLQDANADSIKKESGVEIQLKILEEDNARLKAELEKASKYGGLNFLKDITRLLKKNDDLEECLAKQSDDFEKRFAENKRDAGSY